MNEQQRAVVQQALEALEKVLPCAEENFIHPELQIEVLDAHVAITALHQLLEQPVQEPVGKWMGKCIEWTENPYKFKKGQSIYTTPPAQPAAWVGLMRGVRVDGDSVVISTKSNETARKLCEVLLKQKGTP
jgi:hypothetical protein